jgi:putative SOS response-associated peptidase YedK
MVLDTPYSKSATEKRRCLIPVTGFFEWHREGKTKTPYFFHMNGEIFSLAGLYTAIKDEYDFELPHDAIITTQANDLMAPVHDRMPVIVDKADEATWVSDGLSDVVRQDEVSPLVNSVKNDSPDILTPVRS